HRQYSASLRFFSADPSAPDIYTLSLHDALPISIKVVRARLDNAGHKGRRQAGKNFFVVCDAKRFVAARGACHGPELYQPANFAIDRKSTRLNSSHVKISYAVFCLKKKIYAKHFP